MLGFDAVLDCVEKIEGQDRNGENTGNPIQWQAGTSIFYELLDGK